MVICVQHLVFTEKSDIIWLYEDFTRLKDRRNILLAFWKMRMIFTRRRRTERGLLKRRKNMS